MKGLFFWTMVVCALILGGSIRMASRQLGSLPDEETQTEDFVQPNLTIEDITGAVQQVTDAVRKGLSETSADVPPAQGFRSAIEPSAEELEPICSLMNGASLEIEQKAILSAHDPQAQIQVREKPDTSSKAPHYGLVGDSVTVLNSFWSDVGCWKWYEVEFPSKARGWVRGDLLR